ncbi:MAG: FAD-dependent oxidoreductase [Clostridioides sp.]|jgi:prolycopene isomerase|nr:FAD-dependent oxidoreductase [Clostridioides sp.]
MEQKFDAIVIGAGNGGMSGALTLQKAGKKVLLIEQHFITGGCGSSFVRGRFEFETGLHQLYGIGNDLSGNMGPLHKLFEELEVWDKIEFVPQEDAYRLAFKGMGDVTLPNTRESFVATLQHMFPDEAEKIAEYQELIDKIAVELMGVYTLISEGKGLNEKDYPLLYSVGTNTALDMLNKYFKNPMLSGIYQCLYGYLGMPPERVPFAVLGALYERSGGTWNVHETSMSMSNAVTNTFIDEGGTLKLHSRVEQILIGDNKVEGVVTDDGEKYYAPIVLCNANKINAYVDMIDPAIVPEKVFDDLRVSKPGQSIFALMLGMDCTAKELGIENGTSFLMQPPGSSRPVPYDVNLRLMEDVPMIYITCYDIDDPNYNEPGTCTVTLLVSKTTQPFLEVAPEQYHDMKFDYAEKVLDYVDDFYPEIRKHIEEMEVATPMTLMHYIGSQDGAIYSVDGHIKDLIANKMEARSPFEGLYFCGSSLLYGGFHTTFISGNTAAKLILKDLKDGIVEAKHDFTNMNNVDEIFAEIAASKRYNDDHRSRRGRVRRGVNLFHPDKIEMLVTDIIEETSKDKTIRLTPVNGYIPPFLPGQYINVQVEIDGVKTSNAYSISSSKKDRKYYDITVRANKDGYVSNYLLNDLKISDKLTTSAPAGNFYQINAVHGNKLCFIAGGSGITPFISMLRSDIDTLTLDKEITLIYGCAKKDELIFDTFLNELAEKYPNFNYIPVLSEEEIEGAKSGFITKELIQEVLPDFEEDTFFLCGPQKLYEFVQEQLKELNVPARKIRTEVQMPTKTPWLEEGWHKDVKPEDVFNIKYTKGTQVYEFKAKAGDTIVASMEKAGVLKDVLCRSGECGMCRSRLMNGEVFQLPSAKVRRSDKRYGYIHPCVSYPMSDLEIIL